MYNLQSFLALTRAKENKLATIERIQERRVRLYQDSIQKGKRLAKTRLGLDKLSKDSLKDLLAKLEDL